MGKEEKPKEVVIPSGETAQMTCPTPADGNESRLHTSEVEVSSGAGGIKATCREGARGPAAKAVMTRVFTCADGDGLGPAVVTKEGTPSINQDRAAMKSFTCPLR